MFAPTGLMPAPLRTQDTIILSINAPILPRLCTELSDAVIMSACSGYGTAGAPEG